jgi:phosphoserine aminotransferase
MTQRIHNFGAGPSALPLAVLQKAQENLLSLPGVGMSVLEISHRSAAYDAIYHSAVNGLRSLLAIPEDYEVLFLQGGATLQFSMIPLNFLHGKEPNTADYLVAGSWGKKAAAEAKREGTVNVAWNGSAEKFSRIPTQAELQFNPAAQYVHYTSNETIEGIQMSAPDTGSVALICDASSDFMCRPTDVTKHAVIYAGAQKNAGPSGLAIVLMRKDMLERVPANQHSYLDYRQHAANQSGYNTPNVFAVYILSLVTEWIQNEVGGLTEMAALNTQKANLLYETIDQSNGFYRGHAQTGSRSIMNVTWRMSSEELEKAFAKQATAAGLDGLKGHRSVGGLRASIYNGVPLTSVIALRDFMQEFMRKNG